MEGCAVANRGHDRGCDQWADTGDLSETPAGWVGGGDLFHLLVHRDDLLFKILPLVPEKADEGAHAWCQVRVNVLEDLGHRYFELGWRLREGHAALEQEGSQLVDDGRSSCDETIPDAMKSLQIQLVVCLDRNEAHVLPVDNFSNRLGIKKVVLVGLHKWLHELSWDQLDIVALLLQRAPKEVSPRTCLHPDQRDLYVGCEGNKLLLVNFFRNSTLPAALRATR